MVLQTGASKIVKINATTYSDTGLIILEVDKLYTDIKFKDGDFIVFGPETRGLPDKYVKSDNARTIPMKEGQRSLNLSNSVAIVAYEAIRQNGL